MATKPVQHCEICGREAQGELLESPPDRIAAPAGTPPSPRGRQSYRFECSGPHQGRSGHVWFWMAPDAPPR